MSFELWPGFRVPPTDPSRQLLDLSPAVREFDESPEYEAFLVECAKHCRCTYMICSGVLAGGFCDEIIEDDRDEEEPLP